MEIPPRARGRVTSGHGVRDVHGNTPACAGKSARSRSLPLSCWKYPRVRGEEFTRTFTRAPYSGNTPACAGKRATTLTTARPTRKYPRVRGEEHQHEQTSTLSPEIPPRARGRDMRPLTHLTRSGNTPACAGKSPARVDQLVCERKYPRVRGEESGRRPRTRRGPEIPPRARGRVVPRARRRNRSGNTPACAGKRRHMIVDHVNLRKYPRVRGEERAFWIVSSSAPEIPPRARGRAGGSRAH